MLPRCSAEAAGGAAAVASVRACSLPRSMSAFTVQAVRAFASWAAPARGAARRESLSLAPAVLALRGGELAAYHGAEHISIGTYEHGEERDEGARALRLAPGRPAAR